MINRILQPQTIAMMARSLALSFTLAVSARSASAATTIYTNEADFVAAAGSAPTLLNEFTNFDYLGWLSHPVQASSNGISYSITSQPNLLHLVAFDGALSTTDTNYGIAVTFTSGNITGAGGYFYAADINAAPVSGTVTIALSDGTVTNVASPSGGPVAFLGFLTDGSLINSLSVSYASGTGTPALAHFYAINGSPTLSISLAGHTNLLVSWRPASTNFMLQTVSNLQNTLWTTIGVAPDLVGTQLQVLVPMSNSAAFFRLKKQ